jgi:DNA (cytosine-5)-methyltransferase 1
MMKVLDLFSGIGGFSLGLERAGMETIAFCEFEEHAQRILKKHWPDVPIYDDVRTLDGAQFRGAVDVVCGGFPCQDLSAAGHRKGFEGERSSLYTEMLRIISECMPRYAIFENVTELLAGESGQWFAKFLYDLAEIGYAADWHCISASAIGTAHHRDRVWIIAYPDRPGLEGLDFQKSYWTYSEESRRRELARAIDEALPADDYARLRQNFDAIPEELALIKGDLKAYGNAVVPQIPELIGKAIMEHENG